MYDYPEVVAKIAGDYVARVRSHLRIVPALEREEFLQEIQSHLYEAYQQTPGTDDVERILTVLRKFGEPAEVVADRLPEAMVRTGTKRNLPLRIVGGILIALFGIPLGFGGVAVLAGVLVMLVGVVVTYFAAAGTAFLAGSLILLAGLARTYQPDLWDKLVALGYLQVNVPDEMFNQLSSSEQGLLMILFGSALVAGGLAVLWLGKYLLRGLRFLFALMFDQIRRLAQSARRRLGQRGRTGPRIVVSSAAF
jgi:uncharacterized membrane protein